MVAFLLTLMFWFNKSYTPILISPCCLLNNCLAKLSSSGTGGGGGSGTINSGTVGNEAVYSGSTTVNSGIITDTVAMSD